MGFWLLETSGYFLYKTRTERDHSVHFSYTVKLYVYSMFNVVVICFQNEKNVFIC